jgi:hypothetical protein
MNRLLAIILMLSYGLHSQDHPVEINRLCGLLEHVAEVPVKDHSNTLRLTRTPLPNVALSLYERKEGDPIETTQTKKGGMFRFKTKQPGDYWIKARWNENDYELRVEYRESKFGVECSGQGIVIDDDGEARLWVSIMLKSHLH